MTTLPRTSGALACALAAAAFGAAAAPASATLPGLPGLHPGNPYVPAEPGRPAARGGFAHVGTFTVADNLPADERGSTVTSSEIIDATPDGRTLVYTDSPNEDIGFIDIRDPKRPKPLGTLDVGGEPTSVKIAGRFALVAVNTSASFTDPSGELLVVDIRRQSIVDRIDLAGQPDSIDVSPDGRYAAIVIENERDEDLNDGLIPQLPAGTLQILDLKGRHAGRLRSVDLTGLAMTAPSDPEPEYVDINRWNKAVVSLQENNHLAIVDLRTAKVVRDFSAGTVSLDGIDTTEEELGPQGQGLIELTGSITDRRREPDAVHWVTDTTFATANEGDYEDENGVEGGSRTISIFDVSGRVVWDSGTQLEHDIVRAGHYPEARSENKGNEPEGLEVATIRGQKYLFVNSERANAASVYAIGRNGLPTFQGILPTGIGPEGSRAIPQRGLFVVAAEEDDPEGPRSLVTIYEATKRAAPYPMLVSANEPSGLPIPWTAISGLSADPSDGKTIWAVSDSFLAQAWAYEIDISRTPAVIRQRIAIGVPETDDQTKGEFDLEGIAKRPEGGAWLASEGRTNSGSSRPNLLIRTDDAGAIQQTVALPAELAAQATSSGFEGVAVTGSAAAGDETLYVAIQREWKDDPAGQVKLGRYDVASGTWSFVRYALDPVESPAGGWVGLSEITALPGGKALIVERDNQIGEQARIKRLYEVDLASADWKPYGAPLSTIGKTLERDVLGDLASRSITVPDKLEGVAAVGRRLWLATDNDGVDGNYGETLLFSLDAQGRPAHRSGGRLSHVPRFSRAR